MVLLMLHSTYNHEDKHIKVSCKLERAVAECVAVKQLNVTGLKDFSWII